MSQCPSAINIYTAADQNVKFFSIIFKKSKKIEKEISFLKKIESGTIIRWDDWDRAPKLEDDFNSLISIVNNYISVCFHIFIEKGIKIYCYETLIQPCNPIPSGEGSSIYSEIKIDENAKQTYFPTLIRFGGAYQVNTNINQINNFKFENFDEYDRSFGDVIRLHVRDRYLKVYQQFKVGNVPILTQIVKDVTGNPLQANSNQLINKIQYYAGDYGIGDAATSLAWNNFADYFVDNFRGVVCRLSQDGITPISIINKMNAFFVAKTAAYRKDLNNRYNPDSIYTGDPCIYGVFDANTNKYIIALEEITRFNNCNYNGGTAYIIPPTTTTTTTTGAPTTSTTTVAPSTTTTTSAPVLRVGTSYTVLCAGGGSTITAIVYTGGTNICDSVSISATSFNSLPAGIYYLYISTLGWVEYNKPGGIGTSSMSRVGAGCTACPAQTTTTTNPGYYYNVTRYACDNNCTLLNAGLLGFSSTPLINNYYYNNGDGLGVYYIISSTSIGTINVNLNFSYGNATCNLACAI